MAIPSDPECVRVKHEARAAFDAQTHGMSREERDAYMNRVAADFASNIDITRVSEPIGRGPAVGLPQPRNSAARAITSWTRTCTAQNS